MTDTAIQTAVGEIVVYNVSDADQRAIQAREAHRLGDPSTSALMTGWPVSADDRLPLIVVVDHGRETVSGWLQLPALDPLWIYGVGPGAEPGQYVARR